MVNLEVALGRLRQIQDDSGGALRHFMAPLSELQQYRAYSRTANLDATVYSICSRAASAAGEEAAARRLSLRDFVTRLERNIIEPYRPLAGDRRLGDIRGFGVIALLKAALALGDLAYLATLRAELGKLNRALAPNDPSEAKRYYYELSAV